MIYRNEVRVSQRALEALTKNRLTYHSFLERHDALNEGDAMDCDLSRENLQSWEAGGPFTSMFLLPDMQELIVHTYASRTITRIVLEEEFREGAIRNRILETAGRRGRSG